MRRNYFFWLLLGLCFLFVSMPSYAPALDSTAKKTQGQPAAGKETGKKQSGARRGQGEPARATSSATEISPGQINAREAILVEVSTGTVLFEQNADEAIEPASFTKIAPFIWFLKQSSRVKFTLTIKS